VIRQIKTVQNSNQPGTLSFFEAERDMDFAIKRIYYITNVPKGSMRGGHAHKKLKQLLFCPYGKIEITLDDGTTKSKYLLDDPSKGLIVDSIYWRTMLWLEDNSVLCVAASEYYDESDYIRNYSDFLRYLKNRLEATACS
jgi:dTDP-4-dehydrorhamnose 3,5-epimerase and related enzymes